MRKPAAAGYTLIEVLLAMAVIGLLATIAVPSYQRYVERAQAGRAARDITEIAQVILRFETEKGRLPADLHEVKMDGLKDPWGRHYVYLNLPVNEQNFRIGGGAGTPPDVRTDRLSRPVNTDFDLFSRGKDGSSEARLTGSSSLDDIVRCKDGSFVGFARDFH